MNEMTQLEQFRSEVPPPGPAALKAQEDRLLTAIRLSPARPGRRRATRRLLVGGLATAALAMAVVLGPTLLKDGSRTATAYANAAMDIELRGDEYVATVKDPFADHALYSEAFKAMGLQVTLELLPATPSMVGDAFRYGFADTTSTDRLGSNMEPEGCTPGDEGCFLVVRISKDFKGRGVVYLGREARPGEKYQDNADATAKGEMLEGYAVKGRTVGETVAEARRRGLKVSFQIIEPGKDGGHSLDPNQQSAKVGDHWTVWEAEPEQAGTVRLLVWEKTKRS